MTATADAPVTLFYSYAHEDEPLRDELQGHLKILERRGLIAPWHDRRIVAGDDWAAAIDTHLDRAELVLLLVSKDFVESDYIFGRELKTAMARHADGRAVVVPVFVRAVNLEAEDADVFPFMKLQGLPTDLRPVESWPNRDEAWTQVAKGLRATVKQIIARRPPATGPERTAGAALPMAPGASLPARPPSATSGPAHPAAPALDGFVPPDELLDSVTEKVMAQVADAQRARGSTLDRTAEQALWQEVSALIDQPDAPRLLWVDDRPEGNRLERAALARLQIEVVCVRSADAALAALADALAAAEPFDVVISDWSRAGEPGDSGLQLLRRMRADGHAQPLVLYHGEFDPARRARRVAAAQAAGAAGDAVLPDELMARLHQALQR